MTGMIRRLVTSYLNLNRMLQRRLIDNEIEGYLLPLGAIVQLYREIAAGRPGLVTHVGLGTFVDPEHGGGRVNARTVEDYVERVRLSGRDWLFYPSMRLDAGLLRGTTADPDGNITMEREIGTFQGPSFAQAVRNSGGTVLAQVERIAERGSLDPRKVVIPGHLVDRVVVARPENHPQTFATDYDPVFSGEVRADMSGRRPLPLSVKKVIGRRAAMELRRGDVVNLGVGAPEYVATVAGEEGCGDAFTLTVESGATGGYPAYGLSFGAAINPSSVIDNTYQFDFYDGGGLDITFVGMAELDAAGNVNVSKLRTRIPGIGGFFNVTQGAKRVVFCGQFSAGESDIRAGGRPSRHPAGRRSGQVCRSGRADQLQCPRGPCARAVDPGGDGALRLPHRGGRAGGRRSCARRRSRTRRAGADGLPAPCGGRFARNAGRAVPRRADGAGGAALLRGKPRRPALSR